MVIQSAVKQRLGPMQTPVVSNALFKKRKQTMAGKSARRIPKLFVMLIILFLDWYFIVSAHFIPDSQRVFIQLIELLILAVLSLSLLYYAVFYVTFLLTDKSMKLTIIQKKMLGIKENESGYNTIHSPSQFGFQPSNSTPLTATIPPLHYLTPTNSPLSSCHTTPCSGNIDSSYTPNWFAQSRLPLGGSEKIIDLTTLDRFLKTEQLSSNPDSRVSPLSQFSSDFASVPRKYQLSTRTHSSHLREADSSPSPDNRTMLQSLSKLGISKDDLGIWNNRCKKWLAERIVCPVAKEIGRVNALLQKIGYVDLSIGSMSLTKLHQIAKAKTQKVPTLSLLVPYLELSTKQDYLTSRILELSKGANLSAFHWNSGGCLNGKEWDSTFPNDSQDLLQLLGASMMMLLMILFLILLHLFCSYLDNHFPPNPQYPTHGKAFSSRHFIKSPDKPNLSKRNLCIYQENANPPSYKIILNGQTIELHKGRNNVFTAISVFLYCVKTYYKSTLGSANLDKTGLNVLWIIEQS